MMVKSQQPFPQLRIFFFAFAYYLQQNNITKLFEDNQQDLELATEQLSEFLERDLDAENLVTLKQKVQDKYRYVEQRRHLLLKHCAEGYENNQWVFVKESGQSTNTPNSHQGRKWKSEESPKNSNITQTFWNFLFIKCECEKYFVFW